MRISSLQIKDIYESNILGTKSDILGTCILIFFLACSGCNKAHKKTFESADSLTPGIFFDDEEVLRNRTAAIREVSDKGLALTKLSEGFRRNLYNDAAHYCTIAYGHLIKKASCDGSEPPEFTKGLSEPAGAELLKDDMRIAQIGVLNRVTVDLTDGQFAALCDFVYNVGVKKFGDSSLLKAINKKSSEEVPIQLRRWVLANGKELAGLVNRREAEIALYFDGAISPQPRGRNRAEPLVDILQGEKVKQ